MMARLIRSQSQSDRAAPWSQEPYAVSFHVDSDRADGFRIRKHVETEKLWPLKADLGV